MLDVAKGVATLALLGGFVLYLSGAGGRDDTPGVLDDDETFARAAVGSLWLVGEWKKSLAFAMLSRLSKAGELRTIR